MTRIDWNKPLETDEPTPRPVTHFCEVSPPGATSKVYSIRINDGPPEYVDQNGVGAWNNPKLRNVRAVVTSDEALRRMEALVRKLTTARGTQSHVADEARKIVALLSESSDLVEARRIADALPDRGPYASWLFADACHDDHPLVQCALAALRRGRELAGGESV